MREFFTPARRDAKEVCYLKLVGEFSPAMYAVKVLP